jgi:hypothetical protein
VAKLIAKYFRYYRLIKLIAEGVGGLYYKVFLHKVRVLALVATNLLTLVVRNTVVTTPFRILASCYIKETELSIESKI